jgi:hypothetical protein
MNWNPSWLQATSVSGRSRVDPGLAADVDRLALVLRRAVPPGHQRELDPRAARIDQGGPDRIDRPHSTDARPRRPPALDRQHPGPLGQAGRQPGRTVPQRQRQ